MRLNFVPHIPHIHHIPHIPQLVLLAGASLRLQGSKTHGFPRERSMRLNFVRLDCPRPNAFRARKHARTPHAPQQCPSFSPIYFISVFSLTSTAFPNDIPHIPRMAPNPHFPDINAHSPCPAQQRTGKETMFFSSVSSSCGFWASALGVYC